MLRFALLAAGAAARVMDSHRVVPDGWAEVANAQPSEPVVLRLALRQPRAAQLEQDMLDVSTPGHARYGRHMTREQLRSYTAPTKQAVSSVTAWLRKHGVEGAIDNDWITIRTTVDRANELLDSKFAWYQYEKRGVPKLRTLSYSVPDDLTHHVDLVQPTTRFGQLAAHKSTIFDVRYIDGPQLGSGKWSNAPQAADEGAASCSGDVTPACLRELYKINYTVPAGQKGNLVAFASFLEQYARYKDLEMFHERYLPAAKGQNFSVTLVNDGKNDQNGRSDSGEFLALAYLSGVVRLGAQV